MGTEGLEAHQAGWAAGPYQSLSRSSVSESTALSLRQALGSERRLDTCSFDLNESRMTVRSGVSVQDSADPSYIPCA